MTRIDLALCVALLSCLALPAWRPSATSLRAQGRAPQSIVDGVVEAMCQKQIVLLGELPSHGEAHAFDMKARIADALMAECGFTALLFEAGIYDFIGLERAIGTGTAAREQLDNAIGRFWLTRELAPWRDGLFERASQRRLVVGGLDDQPSITADYARATLPDLVASALDRNMATECRQVVGRHVGWTYDDQAPFDVPEQMRLQRCARAAAETAARQPVDGRDLVMLESFARYADRQRPGTPASRDESMYRNLSWYVDRLPAASRVVVWTATVHAARQRGSLAEMPLGARAVERWGSRVGAVGFTAYAGQTSRAGRPVSVIAEAPPESLEARATIAADWALLDSDTLRGMGSVASRLFGPFASETWANHFDAAVVVRHEVAPTFEPWQ